MNTFKSKSSCPWHSDRIAVLTCDYCGVKACDECIIPAGNKKLCPICRKKWFKYKIMALAVSFVIVFIILMLVFGIYIKLNKDNKKQTLIEILTENIDKNYNDDSSRLKLVILLGNSKQYPKALKHLNFLIKKNPKNSHFYKLYILYSLKSRNTDKALSIVKKAQLRFPSDNDFLKLEGDIWYLLNKNEETEKAWLKAYNLNPKNFDVILKLTDLYVSENRSEDAINILTESWPRFNGVLKKRIGDYLYKLKKSKKMVK